ncbi:MAG TPA: AI-2E family transporter [Opitutaceae bacterium]|nr:AI-2E family transporter [Opitutaceae bacterium]
MLAWFGSAALIIVAFIVLGRLLRFFSGVIWPLAVAAVLALILQPVVNWLERRLRIRRSLSVILLYVAFLLIFAGALVLVLPPLVNQAVDFIAYLPTLWDNVVAYVQQNYPNWVEMLTSQFKRHGLPNVTDLVAGQVKTVATHALPSVRIAFGGMLDAFEFITHIAIIPVYLFFFLLMRGDPTAQLRRDLPFLTTRVREDVVFLADEFISIVESFFRGQLLIGCCMSVLYAAGFTIIGLKFGLVIGIALGLLNIVPYLGTIIGLCVALPLAFFQPGGGWELVGLVVLVKIIVQCIESWGLTPKIMGDRTGLHPAAIIFAIFFWGTAFHGILGMLLAVPLTAFFVTAWRLMKRKYFRGDHA